MAASIPFVRAMDFAYGEAQQVSPLIRRVVANNPGPFTYLGTGVYIIGRGAVAVIDPGPDLGDHLEALKRAIAGERVTHVLVTHNHLDHSGAARAFADAVGAPIYASAGALQGGEPGIEAGDDLGFRPDIAIADGERFAGDGWMLQAVATPGHTANHVAFALAEENALFCGDHIMGWSTTVVTPPDGDMDDYIASLEHVRDAKYSTLWPTHGPPIRDVRPFVQACIDHRLLREAQILDQLAAGQASIRGMVAALYSDVDTRLHPAATYSVWAHLIRLVRAGRATTAGSPSLQSDYRLPP